jgi:hypothetical protein
MENNISVDIKFYDQNNASISIWSKGKIQIKEKLALLLLSSFALRQMHNLQKIGFPLAQVLKAIKSPIDSYFYYTDLLIGKSLKELVVYVPLISSLGVDVKKLIPHMMALRIYEIKSGFNDEKIAKEFWSEVPKIVPEKEVKSKKRFIGNLHLQNEKVIFNLESKGFSLLGRGINYFAPISVVLFIRHLENMYSSDYKFGDRLAKVTNLCGLAQLNNKITIKSQTDLPIRIVDQAYEDNDLSN